MLEVKKRLEVNEKVRSKIKLRSEKMSWKWKKKS